MMPELLVTLALAAEGYPLAATFVVEGKVRLAQMGSRELEELPSADITFVSAALKPDKSAIVASGMQLDGGHSGLFVFDSRKKEWQPLPVETPSRPHSPKFTPDGKHIVFASAETPGEGPEHPSQVWRVEANAPRKAPVLLSMDRKSCHFSPSPLDGQRFVSVGTNCYFDFDVRLENSRSKRLTRLGAAHGATDELAASFDGETVIHSQKRDANFVFSVHRKNKAERVYSFVATTAERPQPQFVCPRDVMFLENGVVRVLNTKTGETKAAGEGMP